MGENDENVHAEINALKKYRRHPDFDPNQPVVLFVFRLKSTGEIKESKPCKHCSVSLRKMANKINLTHVYYSSEIDQEVAILRETSENLENTFVAGMRRSNR